MKKQIHIVSTPIGNYDDITLRALKILKEADIVACEEYKQARRILSHYEIKKELISLNEHNEEESAREIISLINEGKKVAQISDCGAPLFSDPGHILVDQCLAAGIEVIPVPGANSLIPALMGSNLDFEKFYHYGWLSPKKDLRRKELLDLKKKCELIVLMETPYRLKAILADIKKLFGQHQKIVLAYKLTMPEEKFYRGTVSDILKIAEDKSLKGEFVLLVDNR
ncbi:MAG: 16S rRNA (cytidine(1402)-2'-O)-methyltransferase [Melioribacteraceae bacterium]|nr:16S rRNA (cytidine(1402)-2'-O)-methyltransferase [Melioribacteraceae bacterium]